MRLIMDPEKIPDPYRLHDQYHRDGYMVLRRYFSGARIDSALSAVTRALVERSQEIVVDDLSNGRRAFWADVEHPETRHFKFNDLYLFSPEIRELALDLPLSGLLQRLLGQSPALCNSLNFQKGSSQPRHIDSLYMTPQTPGALIATWTALEDAHPDSGPLVYYPGSHLIPLYRFQDGTRHANFAEMADWNRYIAAELEKRKIPEQVFLAQKGDVFIWHSELLHGGGVINDPARTRNSLVCHYFSESDCRAQKCHLEPLHQGYWMRRLSQPVKVPPERFLHGQKFPEARYLSRYPDIKAAVAAGTCLSGWSHYHTFGYAEGRGV